MGAERGTNQTGELCGVMQGLLWLLEYAADDMSDVAICVDSLYAGNELEGFWKKNCNAALNRGAISVGACASDEERDICAREGALCRWRERPG